MRYLFGLVCICALGVVGCGETNVRIHDGTGGTGGDGGTGGTGGAGGSGGTGGTMPMDACTNQDDLAIICEGQFVDLAGSCGRSAGVDCLGISDDAAQAQCLSETSSQCIEEDTGTSEGCSDCFGDTIACIEANCGSCIGNQDGQECLICRDENCNDALYQCTGDIVEGCDGEVWCQRVDCDDFVDCTEDVCNPISGVCTSTPLDDGTPCAGGMCQSGACALNDSVLPCTEQGIRNAIAEGGGPYAFGCAGATTVVTKAEIVIDNDVILDGGGNLTVDGNRDHPVFSVPPGVTAELRGFGVTRGRSVGAFNQAGTLRLTNSTVWGNEGPGILNEGTMIATGCVVSENDDHGISNHETMIVTNSNASGNGAGGILNGGTATIFDSAVSGNSGNGIDNWGTLSIANSTMSGNARTGIVNEGTLGMQSCTVSDNSEGGIHSSGIFECVGTMVITNSTLSGNGGEALYACGSTTITNSTVSGSVVADGDESSVVATATLIEGACSQVSETISWTSNGYNIESPGNTCGFDDATDRVNVTAGNLMLGPLADNGGLTETRALLPGSVAIDVIPAAMCQLNADQRGVARPQGAMCDVGAFELQQ